MVWRQSCIWLSKLQGSRQRSCLPAAADWKRRPAPPPPVVLGGYPPWTLHQSPDQIALRWYPDATPTSAANETAGIHCRTWNKSAELVSDTRDGSAEIAEYRCR